VQQTRGKNTAAERKSPVDRHIAKIDNSERHEDTEHHDAVYQAFD